VLISCLWVRLVVVGARLFSSRGNDIDGMGTSVAYVTAVSEYDEYKLSIGNFCGPGAPR